MIKLTAVETTCAVDFYTVVDTSRSPDSVQHPMSAALGTQHNV